jgi:hypothetical protein
MSLAPGIKLGPYEILPLVGAGGMGEVYVTEVRAEPADVIRILKASSEEESSSDLID